MTVKKIKSVSLFCVVFSTLFTASCVFESKIITEGDDETENIICGDGKIGAGEVCDDGNRDNSDGCSDSCQIETGWACDSPEVNGAGKNVFVSQIVVRRIGDCVFPLLRALHPQVESTLKPSKADPSVKIPTQKLAKNSTTSNFEKCFVDPPANSSDSRTTFKTEFTYEVNRNTGNKVLGYSKVGDDVPDSFFPFLNESRFAPFTAVFTIKYMEDDNKTFEQQWPVRFTFTSDDDLYVYVDGHLVVNMPGPNLKTNFSSKKSMIQLPNGRHSQKGKVHTLQAFYINRGGVGKIRLQIPTTVVSTCYKPKN